MLYYFLLFQLTNEINSSIETNYGDHNFTYLTNKLSCISRLSRSWWRICRACCAVYSMRDTARTTFYYIKMHGLDSESWRVVVVTWRNRWNLGLRNCIL